MATKTAPSETAKRLARVVMAELRLKPNTTTLLESKRTGGRIIDKREVLKELATQISGQALLEEVASDPVVKTTGSDQQSRTLEMLASVLESNIPDEMKIKKLREMLANQQRKTKPVSDFRDSRSSKLRESVVTTGALLESQGGNTSSPYISLMQRGRR